MKPCAATPRSRRARPAPPRRKRPAPPDLVDAEQVLKGRRAEQAVVEGQHRVELVHLTESARPAVGLGFSCRAAEEWSAAKLREAAIFFLLEIRLARQRRANSAPLRSRRHPASGSHPRAPVHLEQPCDEEKDAAHLPARGISSVYTPGTDRAAGISMLVDLSRTAEPSVRFREHERPSN